MSASPPPLETRDRHHSSRVFFPSPATRTATGFPWCSLADALCLLRIVTALLFMAHASMRFVLGTIPQFGTFMEAQGFPHGQVWVLAITFYELCAGSLLILNRGVRWAASGLAVIVLVGIGLIHRHNGWFVGEHGTGGSEYSVALLAMLLVIAANDAARASHPTLHAGESDPA